MKMGHSWGRIDHYGFVPFSYICPSFNKKTIRVSMITVNKKWLRLIGIVGCTVWMASCKQATDAGVKPSFAIMEVKAADKELSTSYSATIRGRQDIDIYPQVSGTIEKLCVTEGQTVRRGQLLFVIDQIPYRAALKTAVANVEAARAAMATAELTYNSNKELYAQKVVSEFSLKTAENTYLTAKAQLTQAEAQEVNARNNLSYTEVKSPSDGVVGALPYRVGALVGANLPYPLTTVSDNSDMYVYFSMTENQLLALTRQYGSMDEALKNMPEVELILNDNSVYNKKGVIESISGVIDRQTGTVMARVVFPNESRLLHSGASGTVVVPSIYKDCIAIPQGATVQMQDKVVVYKVVDGKAVSTLITVAGINDGREYVVLSGLQSGDEIISEGAGLVREGTQVK
jgi:membrane fusion protein (multidrug efflux system)